MQACNPRSIDLAEVVAVIDEQRCIGCTLCIRACPVDAIVGAAKLMHTVIAGACTGCELCIAPCPVDCISLRPIARPAGAARLAAMDLARRRCEARNRRLERESEEKTQKVAAQRAAGADRKKRDTVARAVERARQRLKRLSS